MSLKVSSKPIPGGMTREPRLSVAVGGAEDLGAYQGALVNPYPPCRASPKAFSPSVPLLQWNHLRDTGRQSLKSEPLWVQCRAGVDLGWVQRNSCQMWDHTLWMVVRGSNWEYKNGSKTWPTEEPCFWTAAMSNAFSIDLDTSLFGGFSVVTKQLMAFLLWSQ